MQNICFYPILSRNRAREQKGRRRNRLSRHGEANVLQNARGRAGARANQTSWRESRCELGSAECVVSLALAPRRARRRLAALRSPAAGDARRVASSDRGATAVARASRVARRRDFTNPSAGTEVVRPPITLALMPHPSKTQAPVARQQLRRCAARRLDAQATRFARRCATWWGHRRWATLRNLPTRV